MSSRFRRNYSTRRRYSTRFRRFGRTSSGLVRRSKGNMKAANQQNDSSTVVINLMHTLYSGVSKVFDSYDNDGQLIPHNEKYLGVTPVNIFDLLRKSDFFNSYAGMYDQFKVNSIKVKITPVQWSVFDQSRSTVNFKNNAPDGATQINRSGPVNAIPTIDDYIENPDYNPRNNETKTNPRYIVPGILPIGNNYINIDNCDNVIDEWLIAQGYKSDIDGHKNLSFMVNTYHEDGWVIDANNNNRVVLPANHDIDNTANACFNDGTVNRIFETSICSIIYIMISW